MVGGQFFDVVLEESPENMESNRSVLSCELTNSTT